MDLDTTDSPSSSSADQQRQNFFDLAGSQLRTIRGNTAAANSNLNSTSDSETMDNDNNSCSTNALGTDGFIRRRSSNSNSTEYFSPIRSNDASSSSSTHFLTNRSRAIVKERESLCTSPVSAIVGSALKQMNLKRSSSAPMINQLGVTKEAGPQRFSTGLESPKVTATTSASTSRPNTLSYANSPLVVNRETPMEIGDASSFATSYLASLNNPRPRRFSASFSPQGSPGPAPNRVHQLRNESNTDWETASEKEFIGTMSIAQSWEDLSLDSMNMDVPARRASVSEQLWLSINPGTSSASSSPAASPRILSSRFSPAHSSPSPTRRSFTTRRSLSPIAVRPSVLAVGLGTGVGLKRKSDWDSSSSNNQMDCSPQPPAKRAGGLLSWSQQSPYSGTSSGMSSPVASPLVNHHLLQCQLISHGESPSSLDTGTESSSSIGGADNDSPFFRPVEDSPLNSPSDTSPETNPCQKTS